MSIDYRRLTYRQLADILGISLSGAHSLVTANNWPKYISFDGRARITVPLAALEPRKDNRKRGNATPNLNDRKAERMKARKAADQERKEQIRQFYRDHAAALTYPQNRWQQAALFDLD